MTDGDTKTRWTHPPAADCVFVTTGSDKAVDKARIGTSRAIIAVAALRDGGCARADGASRLALRPTDRTIPHALSWSRPNRPNVEIQYVVPKEGRPADRRSLTLHLPEGSIHLSDVMDLDLAEEIASLCNEAATQSLDRGWKTAAEDERRAVSWGSGLHDVVAERLLHNPVASRIRDDAVAVRDVILPTPWSPVMVRLSTASGATIPAEPLSDLHAGDPLLAAACRSAPMMAGLEGGGTLDALALYFEGHVQPPAVDPLERMRCIALVQEESR